MPAPMSQSPEARAGSIQDPGEVDNRLSLDPNDPDFSDTIADWEDGEEYKMTVKVRQISPGEFEVISASGENAESDDEGEYEEESEGKPRVRSAVRSMMESM